MGKVLRGGVGEFFAAEAAVECDSHAFCDCFVLVAFEEILGETGGRFENSEELCVGNRKV